MSYTDYFNLPYYLSLISGVSEIIKVKDYKRYKKGLILRHDVDFSLELAYELSKIEKAIGIVSTYYILTTSDIYNPFSVSSRRMLEDMIKDDMELGIHFDPAIYGIEMPDGELIENLLREIQIFEMFLGRGFRVSSFSIHQPSSFGRYVRTGKLIGAYDEEIFSNDKYISDTNFSFYGKDPAQWVRKSEEQRIQLVIHPMQYMIKEVGQYEEFLKRTMQARYDKLDSYLYRNRLYRRQCGDYKDVTISVNRHDNE